MIKFYFLAKMLLSLHERHHKTKKNAIKMSRTGFSVCFKYVYLTTVDSAIFLGKSVKKKN